MMLILIEKAKLYLQGPPSIFLYSEYSYMEQRIPQIKNPTQKVALLNHAMPVFPFPTTHSSEAALYRIVVTYFFLYLVVAETASTEFLMELVAR